MSAAGRPKKIKYEELGFRLIKLNNKNVALCNNCKQNLQNTASSRLIAHRNRCSRDTNRRNSTASTEISVLDEIGVEFVDLYEEKSNEGTVSVDEIISASGSCSSIGTAKPLSEASSSVSIQQLSRASICTSSCPKIKRNVTKQRDLSKFVDVLTEPEKIKIHNAIGNFFFGCNIPLRIIESIHFKNMINELRPSYTKLLPNRRVLSSNILEQTYKRCLENTQKSLPPNSVLVIDGWKNSSSNAKTVVSIVHNSDGSKALINAWDLSGESETADRLTEIVMESTEIAKERYGIDIYAVVSDNAATMVKMGKNINHILWHSTCHSHIGNLLIKDLIDLRLTENVNTVLKEFKNLDFEKQIVIKGGSKIKLACDQFIDDVQATIELLDPVCELINFCQKSDASLADAVHLWLSLDINADINKLNHRRNMALNVYALTAYYFHPRYDTERLGKEHFNLINNFLLRNLSGSGLDQLDQFKTKSGIFEILCGKEDIKRPSTFWRMAEYDCPELAKLALMVLNLPASSGQIERVFSNWGIIHTPIRNRLTFDRSKKLLHVYFSLNANELLVLPNQPIDSDDEGN